MPQSSHNAGPCAILARAVNYTLSLHDALPICKSPRHSNFLPPFTPIEDEWYLSFSYHKLCFREIGRTVSFIEFFFVDRKSTRLNSSHEWISDAVFCLKKNI